MIQPEEISVAEKYAKELLAILAKYKESTDLNELTRLENECYALINRCPLHVLVDAKFMESLREDI